MLANNGVPVAMADAVTMWKGHAMDMIMEIAAASTGKQSRIPFDSGLLRESMLTSIVTDGGKLFQNNYTSQRILD